MLASWASIASTPGCATSSATCPPCALRERVEAAGLDAYMTGNMTVAKSDRIHLGLPGRDDVIADFQRSWPTWARRASTSPPLPGSRRGVELGRRARARGARARRVDLDEMRRGPSRTAGPTPRRSCGTISPTLSSASSPWPRERGCAWRSTPTIPPPMPWAASRCIIRSVESYRRAFQIARSHALGMEFCTGCWLEGASALATSWPASASSRPPGASSSCIFATSAAPLPQFVETFLDNGYMDMGEVMRALVETGYTGTVTLDHTPPFVGDYANGGGGLRRGYMKALLQSIQREKRLAAAWRDGVATSH